MWDSIFKIVVLVMTELLKARADRREMLENWNLFLKTIGEGSSESVKIKQSADKQRAKIEELLK